MLPCSPSFFLSAPTHLDLCQLLSVGYLVFILHTHYLIWCCPASSTKVRPKRVGLFPYVSFCHILFYFWLLSPSHCAWPHVSPAQVLTQSCSINGSHFILYLLQLFTSICSMKIWAISSKWETAGSHIGKPCSSLSCLLYLHNPAQPLSSQDALEFPDLSFLRSLMHGSRCTSSSYLYHREGRELLLVCISHRSTTLGYKLWRLGIRSYLSILT